MEMYLVPSGYDLTMKIADRFGKVNVLLSIVRQNYEFASYIYLYREPGVKIMIDSGAYSEMQGTLTMELDAYLPFVENSGHLVDYCVNLDVDPENYDVRMYNLAKLSKVADNVLPVVHDPYAGEIDALYDMGYHYIMLGSSWGRDQRQLDFIFNRYYFSGKYPGIKFHKLGSATYKILSSHPYYSSDSAAFELIGAVGEVLYWNEQCEPDSCGDHTHTIYFGGLAHEDKGRNWMYNRYPWKSEFEEYLWKTFEYTLKDIEGPNGAHKRWIVNAKYMLDLEKRVTEIHEKM